MRAVNALPGDKVEIELANEKLQGNLIESPDAEILLLKLKSGYNVGFRKENVLRLRVIERRKEQPKLKPGEGKKGLPLLGMVLTGGTIVSKLDSRTGAAAPLASVEELQEFYSDVFEMASFIIEKPMLMDSSAMGPSDWVKIAKVCAELLKKTEGVIVLHGTDSLHYTSSALSFYLQNLGKPVVLTFSQRSIDRGSSDARL
ncbi:Glu-tRNA(Gln) amidotransferase GatDE subunit D, partial [Candidatus Pacearchaeota archaeon]